MPVFHDTSGGWGFLRQQRAEQDRLAREAEAQKAADAAAIERAKAEDEAAKAASPAGGPQPSAKSAPKPR